MLVRARGWISGSALRAFARGAATAMWMTACGGAAKSALGDSATSDAGGASGIDASSVVTADGGGGVVPPPSGDSGSPVFDDAEAEEGSAPRNALCTPLSEQTGTVVNSTHGRLDGTLVYVVPVGGPGRCNGDDSHVHLQVEVSGLVYDVAVDIGATGDEVGMYEETIAVPGGAWAEGWHGTDTLAYPTLGLKSTEFPTLAPADVASAVESAVANTSKISIFCEGYTPGDNGCHDVHYENGDGKDGALVLDPTAATSPVLFFRFQADTF